MSMRYTRIVLMKCDVCGKEQSYGHTNDMTARVIAQREGWQYAIYLAPETQIENGARRFPFDTCPDCSPPQQLAQCPITMTGEARAASV